MVEQSMNSRDFERASNPPSSIASYVDLTWCGSGRQVITVSCVRTDSQRRSLTRFLMVAP